MHYVNQLAALDSAKAVKELNETDSVTVVIDGTEEKIAREDLLIETVKNEKFVSTEDHGITVVLDTNLTEELINEGFVREIISKVQTMRKDAGFEVMDKITVGVSGNDKIAAICQKNADEIKRIVMAESITENTADGFVKEWNLNGEDVTLSVKKL